MRGWDRVKVSCYYFHENTPIKHFLMFLADEKGRGGQNLTLVYTTCGYIIPLSKTNYFPSP